MGIRIHKTIGYGLDLKNLDYSISPDEIRNAIGNEDFDLCKSLEKFYDEIGPRHDIMARYSLKELKEKKNSGIYQFVNYDDEFGLDNIIQYDDDIDYIDRSIHSWD